MICFLDFRTVLCGSQTPSSLFVESVSCWVLVRFLLLLDVGKVAPPWGACGGLCPMRGVRDSAFRQMPPLPRSKSAEARHGGPTQCKFAAASEYARYGCRVDARNNGLYLHSGAIVVRNAVDCVLGGELVRWNTAAAYRRRTRAL